MWFFSLDAAHKLAVRVARATFGLPYFDATMSSVVGDDQRVSYASTRTRRGVVGAEFKGSYQPENPGGPVFQAKAGTLEHFLVERYCLYTMRRGRLLRGDIWHEPWPLQRASCDLSMCDMARLAGVALEGPPASVLYADSLKVKAWLPVAV